MEKLKNIIKMEIPPSISQYDLIAYYKSYNGQRESNWKEKLGKDLNWQLSFDNLKEKDTTKHIHRLHPYKGKFIPQLVEYFLDSHTDNFKKKVYFKQGSCLQTYVTQEVKSEGKIV